MSYNKAIETFKNILDAECKVEYLNEKRMMSRKEKQAKELYEKMLDTLASHFDHQPVSDRFRKRLMPHQKDQSIN